MVSWVSVLLMGRVYDFHEIYISFLNTQESERWLLAQCEDDHFYHKMASHSDVCNKVLTNSQISAVLYAINNSLLKLKYCGLYDCSEVLFLLYQGGVPVLVCLCFVYMLAPSFVLPCLHSAYDKYAQKNFEKKCSPHIYYQALNDVDIEKKYIRDDI